ncbi:hypothetical protein N9Z83_02255 [Akkermansiaceae bacterium]|nr:hypothetical protein [Akkermansiaceae bacterium]
MGIPKDEVGFVNLGSLCSKTNAAFMNAVGLADDIESGKGSGGLRLATR